MQFYWHYKNGRIRVFQRQTAAFSPILSRQLSKFDLTKAGRAAIAAAGRLTEAVIIPAMI
jgi:hypothetical protein